MHLARSGVALDKRAVRHSRVVEHHIRPHAPDERERGPGAVCEEVRFEFKT